MTGTDLLRDKIDSFIAEKNRPQVYNHRYFCDMLGMTKATFSRTINGKRTPSIEEIQKICQILGRPQDAKELLNKYYLSSELRNSLFDSEVHPYILGNVLQYLVNPRYFDLMLLARNKRLSYSQYVKDYGTQGQIRIQELIDLEILIPNGDELNICAEYEGQLFDIPVIKKLIQNTIGFHKESNMGHMKNQIFFMSRAIDKTKRTRIYEILNTVRLIVTEIAMYGKISADNKNKMISLLDFDHGTDQGETDVVALGLVFDDLNASGAKDVMSKEILQ